MSSIVPKPEPDAWYTLNDGIYIRWLHVLTVKPTRPAVVQDYWIEGESWIQLSDGIRYLYRNCHYWNGLRCRIDKLEDEEHQAVLVLSR